MHVPATPHKQMRMVTCVFLVCTLGLLTACENEPPVSTTPESDDSTGSSHPSVPPESPSSPTRISRIDALPPDAARITPESDLHPPILHSGEFHPPKPLSGGINTAGAEDSAFVTPDGTTMYFFFTPDVHVPPERQLLDGVTGIYVSRLEGATWSEAERVVLQDPGNLALDGAPFVLGEEMWFAAAREGNYRAVDMWTAHWKDSEWRHWQNAGAQLNAEYQIGEMHLTADGQAMYFHADRPGGKGGYDIWMTTRSNGEWSEPVNVVEVNSPETDGWPFITEDGRELWFTRIHMGTPAVFRAVLGPTGWEAPEMIVSQFAAEPTLDRRGNLYFVHHFFRDGQMLEADIYVARRK